MLLIATDGGLVGEYECDDVTAGSQGEGEGNRVGGGELVSHVPLDSVIPEMRPLSEEENDNSEEDYDDVIVVAKERSSWECFEEKHGRKEKKRRRLVKVGKLVNKEDVPPTNIMNVEDERVNEEPSSLVHKSSKKYVLAKPKRGSCVKEVEIDKEKSAEEKESGEKSKYEKKEKSVKKSQKRNASDREELSSSKKAKVNVSEVERRENLKKQKSPKVYEEEVRNFYADLFSVEDNNMCLKVNGVNFVMDDAVLGNILGVPTEGLSYVKGCSERERVHEKALLPEYQLMFEMVNKTAANDEIRRIKDRNAILEGQLSQAIEEPGSSSAQCAEVSRLTTENADLRKQVEDLKEQLMNEQRSANARVNILLKALASSSFPPSFNAVKQFPCQ
ncbi:protein pxr1-like [Nicotiana tomentosiformis]|uniref:protein pxr1-like n=1 Tax=Nicotiana tomentosiformis TaxID=4098 RepID=UPI00388C94AE